MSRSRLKPVNLTNFRDIEYTEFMDVLRSDASVVEKAKATLDYYKVTYTVARCHKKYYVDCVYNASGTEVSIKEYLLWKAAEIAAQDEYGDRFISFFLDLDTEAVA
jgi:hypothetical protein